MADQQQKQHYARIANSGLPASVLEQPRTDATSWFHISVLLPHLFAGIMVGLVTFTFSLSCAALIFSGSLSTYLPFGIGMAMVSAILSSSVVALRSSFPFAIAGPDVHAAVILALMAGAIATQLQNNSAAVFPTIWLALILSTTLTGVFLFLMGRLRLGIWVRFIPYPVIGGFLAGTGWLTTRGSFKVMMGQTLNLTALAEMLQPDRLITWLPGIVFALVLFWATQRYKHFLLLPGILLGAIALFHLLWQFYLTIVPAGAPIEVFLSFPSGHSTTQLGQFPDLNLVDWTVLWGQIPNLVVGNATTPTEGMYRCA
jgi:SulP family sulfate permease